jgi:hypothetical protein
MALSEAAREGVRSLAPGKKTAPARERLRPSGGYRAVACQHDPLNIHETIAQYAHLCTQRRRRRFMTPLPLRGSEGSHCHDLIYFGGCSSGDESH